jgi:hypothetical protein
MKKASLLVLLVAVSAWAQSGAEGNTAGAVTPQGTLPTTASFPIQRVQMPTYADVYCAGFINRQSLPDANFVAGGLETPSTTKFVRGDLVYLEGAGYSVGAEYEIVRALARYQRIRNVSRAQAKLLRKRPDSPMRKSGA